MKSTNRQIVESSASYSHGHIGDYILENLSILFFLVTFLSILFAIVNSVPHFPSSVTMRFDWKFQLGCILAFLSWLVYELFSRSSSTNQRVKCLCLRDFNVSHAELSDQAVSFQIKLVDFSEDDKRASYKKTDDSDWR